MTDADLLYHRFDRLLRIAERAGEDGTWLDETADLITAMFRELAERRELDTPKRVALLARRRELRRLNADMEAKGLSTAQRVRELEDCGVSRSVAYGLVREFSDDQPPPRR